jgi:hypothetical protein
VGDGVGVADGLGVGVGVATGVGSTVGVCVTTGSTVGTSVGIGVGASVGDGVAVGETVGVGEVVAVGVGVAIGATLIGAPTTGTTRRSTRYRDPAFARFGTWPTPVAYRPRIAVKDDDFGNVCVRTTQPRGSETEAITL